MTGFLIIQKPTGITSYDAIRAIKKCLPPKTKIGHSGTLDPLATGVLIIAIGRAYTKQLNDLLTHDKTYLAEITLGKQTDTYDIDGQITHTHDKAIAVSHDEVSKTLDEFVGTIDQHPPAFSAKKVNGTPAYKLARQGTLLDLPAKPITIYSITLTSDSLPDSPTFSILVHCSKGTYIRTLAHDIGQALGVGACLSALSRTAIGNVTIEHAVHLSDITPTTIQSHLLRELPA